MQQKPMKNVTHVDVSSFASKTNLVNLKTEVDKSDIAKVTPVPDDLAKLSNVVKNGVVKKTICDNLVTKIDNTDTTGFVSKAKYDTDKSDLEKKISDAENKATSGLVKKTDYSFKTTEIENKIPSISGLVTKTDYNTKINEIKKKITDHDHDKYITTSEFNKLTTKF